MLQDWSAVRLRRLGLLAAALVPAFHVTTADAGDAALAGHVAAHALRRAG